MNQENSGRVTFMPLNRLHTQHGQIPSGQDAIPMVSKLKFLPEYRLAFDQVCSRDDRWIKIDHTCRCLAEPLSVPI